MTRWTPHYPFVQCQETHAQWLRRETSQVFSVEPPLQHRPIFVFHNTSNSNTDFLLFSIFCPMPSSCDIRYLRQWKELERVTDEQSSNVIFVDWVRSAFLFMWAWLRVNGWMNAPSCESSIFLLMLFSRSSHSSAPQLTFRPSTEQKRANPRHWAKHAKILTMTEKRGKDWAFRIKICHLSLPAIKLSGILNLFLASLLWTVTLALSHLFTTHQSHNWVQHFCPSLPFSLSRKKEGSFCDEGEGEEKRTKP